MSVLLNLYRALIEKTKFDERCLDCILKQTALKTFME